MPRPPDRPVIDVVMPGRDVAATVGAVIAELPPRRVRSVVVVDYDSRDTTAQAARDAGAVVLRARGGYGAACRRATEHLCGLPCPSDIVVFMAADGSDDPSELPRLLAPMLEADAELVIGARADALPHAGQRVTLSLIRTIYRHRFQDLGPYRAIRLPALVALGLSDPGPGYHVQMQIKALRLGLRIAEVPVTPRRTGRRQPRLRQMAEQVGHTGNALFHILRHSTAR